MRYVLIVLPEDVIGGVDADVYGVLDTTPASGPPVVIARANSLPSASTIRNALNAS